MNTYYEGKRQKIDGKWFYWRGWTSGDGTAVYKRWQDQGHDPFVSWSTNPHRYGGQVITEPGWHIWTRRMPTIDASGEHLIGRTPSRCRLHDGKPCWTCRNGKA